MQGGVIQTERLTLRPLTVADAGDIAVALSDWQVARWLTRVPYPYTQADAEAFIARNVGNVGTVWAIEDSAGLVGIVGARGEFGYWLSRRAWGRGYATEFGQAVLGWFFAQPDACALMSGHHIGNDRSAGVLEKLGFRITGHDLVPTVRGDSVVIRRMILAPQAWHSRMWLQTARLEIRPLRIRDAAALARIGGQPDVARMLAVLPSPWALAHAERWIAAGAWRGTPGFRLGVWMAGGPLIGMVGVGGQPHSVAFFIDPAHAGQGYATDAMRAMLTDVFARFSIDVVEADHFADNPASGRVLAKLGFQQVGTSIAKSAARVEPAPIVLYRLTKARFESLIP